MPLRADRAKAVWIMSGIGTAGVAIGAVHYGVDWFLALGVMCWIDALVYAALAERSR
jgi:hypothetical protein